MIGCRLQVGAGGSCVVCRPAQEHAPEPPGEPGDTGAGTRPRHTRHPLPEGRCLRNQHALATLGILFQKVNCLHQQKHMKLSIFV